VKSPPHPLLQLSHSPSCHVPLGAVFELDHPAADVRADEPVRIQPGFQLIERGRDPVRRALTPHVGQLIVGMENGAVVHNLSFADPRVLDVQIQARGVERAGLQAVTEDFSQVFGFPKAGVNLTLPIEVHFILAFLNINSTAVKSNGDQRLLIDSSTDD
jgi:hypothetical protein